jgi:hypothetical protein
MFSRVPRPPVVQVNRAVIPRYITRLKSVIKSIMKNEGNSAPCRVLILCVTFIVFIVNSSGALAPFRAGKFSNSAITELAGNLGGEFGAHLGWFADTAQLFTFKGHDGLPLQGYYIPAPIESLSADPLPVLIHCAGWSETSLKYSKFLRILHTEGYPIYSFDLRGQGFSSATGTDATTSLMDACGRQLAASYPTKYLLDDLYFDAVF